MPCRPAVTRMKVKPRLAHTLDSATDQRFQAANTLTMVRGAHVLTAGGEVNWTSMNQTFVGFARGRYIFTGGMDQFEAFVNDPTSNAATSAPVGCGMVR